MTIKRVLLFLMLVLLVFSSQVHGLSVTAQVDKNQITRDDAVFLQVEVDNTKAEIDTSLIKDFDVRSRGSSSLTQMINGKIERKKTYQFMLIPLGQGRLAIPPVVARYKTETARTDPIAITVVKETIDPGQAKSFFATAQMSKDSVYTGQQTVYTLKFFNSKKISRLGFETPPGFKDLAVKSFEKEKAYTQRINGVVYRVTQVDYLILPSSPGHFTIDPATLVAQAVVQTGQNRGLDPFFTDPFFSRQQTRPVRVQTLPKLLEVKPLPLYQGNFPFSGLIGQFLITSSIDRTTLKAGESLTLSVEVSGSGNIMDAALPEVKIDPDRFKVYDDNPIESIQLTPEGYEGKKVFKRAVVPIVPGKIELPPVTLVYFDVHLNDYHTVSTQPVVIDVSPSQEIQVTQAPQQPQRNRGADKKEVALINRDILEIKEGLFVLENYSQMKPVAFLVWVILPGILFLGIKFFTTVISKEMPIRKIMLKKASKSLKMAQKNQENKEPDEAFYAHLYSAMVAMVLSKGNRQSETLTIEETRKLLKDKAADKDIDETVDLLQTLESIRFGNVMPDERRKADLGKKAAEIFKRLAMVIILCLVLGFSPSQGQAQPSKNYFDALKSYQNGEYEAAAHQFERIAQTPVQNPYLYFNIGNAYLKTGDIGRAILWYERSKKMSPNDPDLKFNLAFANTQVKDKREEKVDLMKILFFWDGWISLKIMQAAAITFSSLFFVWAAMQSIRRRRIFTGTGTLILSVFLIVFFITTVSMLSQVRTNKAVILEKEVIVRSGTMDNATQLFTLHAGTIIHVQDQKNDHIKIVFSKDKVGWIARSQAELI